MIEKIKGAKLLARSLAPFFLLFLIFLDRLTKWFVLKYPDFYFKNTKLYFLNINPIILNLLIAAVLILLIFLFFKTLKQGSFVLTFGFSLVILGGLSNFFDRLYFGYVIDWIRIFILPISIFNIADVMIIGGIIILLIKFSKMF